MSRMVRVAHFLPLLMLVACGELNDLPTEPGEGPHPDDSATFSRVQIEIFTPTCAAAGCHDPSGQQEGMILSAGRSYAMIVGVSSREMPALRRVEPGDPSNSYLYRKVIGSGISGTRMPPGGQLTELQIALLRDWIRRGAPND